MILPSHISIIFCYILIYSVIIVDLIIISIVNGFGLTKHCFLILKLLIFLFIPSNSVQMTTHIKLSRCGRQQLPEKT